MAIAWTPDLSIGIREIDEQHQEMFKQINNLLEAFDQGKGPEGVSKMIAFLENYAIEHFGAEENYMFRFKYPNDVHHRIQHRIFRRNLLNLKSRLDTEGASGSLLDATHGLVVTWLNNHIRNVDKLLGSFLKTRLESQSVPLS
jgi:hemerythrin